MKSKQTECEKMLYKMNAFNAQMNEDKKNDRFPFPLFDDSIHRIN